MSVPNGSRPSRAVPCAGRPQRARWAGDDERLVIGRCSTDRLAGVARCVEAHDRVAVPEAVRRVRRSGGDRIVYRRSPTRRRTGAARFSDVVWRVPVGSGAGGAPAPVSACDSAPVAAPVSRRAAPRSCRRWSGSGGGVGVRRARHGRCTPAAGGPVAPVPPQPAGSDQVHVVCDQDRLERSGVVWVSVGLTGP